MRKFVKLIKLFPLHFPTYKIHVSVSPTISGLYFMFDLLLPFMDRYVFLRSTQFSIVSPKLSNQALNRTGSQNQNPVPSLEDAWNAWRLNIVYDRKGAFSSLFWLKNFFKIIYLFAIFPSEDGKQLPSRLYVALFQFYAGKCPKDPEVAEEGELCGSTPLHPVRCPVYFPVRFHDYLIKG